MNINYGIGCPSRIVMRALSKAALLRSLLLLGGGALLVTSAIGCGTPGVAVSASVSAPGAQSSAASPDRAHIVAVYRSHCGACHRPVAPGSEPNDRLAVELTKHHKRTRLSESEWAGLDAFLARPQ